MIESQKFVKLLHSLSDDRDSSSLASPFIFRILTRIFTRFFESCSKTETESNVRIVKSDWLKIRGIFKLIGWNVKINKQKSQLMSSTCCGRVVQCIWTDFLIVFLRHILIQGRMEFYIIIRNANKLAVQKFEKSAFSNTKEFSVNWAFNFSFGSIWSSFRQ